MSDQSSNLAGLNILLGVTGGIAAYKAANLASKLTTKGALVDCILTRNAAKLVRPRTFQAVTQRPVHTSMWKIAGDFNINHIGLAETARIVVVAPATANIVAKLAHGICDDLLSTTLCACHEKPILLAPAMNDKMWTNPVVQKNIEMLGKMKIETIGPETGHLACGTEAVGRMSEPTDILKRIEQIAESI